MFQKTIITSLSASVTAIICCDFSPNGQCSWVSLAIAPFRFPNLLIPKTLKKSLQAQRWCAQDRIVSRLQDCQSAFSLLSRSCTTWPCVHATGPSFNAIFYIFNLLRRTELLSLFGYILKKKIALQFASITRPVLYPSKHPSRHPCIRAFVGVGRKSILLQTLNCFTTTIISSAIRSRGYTIVAGERKLAERG
jgi:hypothetical protein